MSSKHELAKDCCDGCSLGLKAGGDCTPLGLGSPWDDAFVECCTPEQTTQITNRAPSTNGCINSPCDQICEVVDGPIGYRCSCHPGYRVSSRDSTLCEDVDECADESHNCVRLKETCSNLPGRFECIERTNNPCPQGYVFNPRRSMCDDVNECENPETCPNDHTCRNIIGTFLCIPPSNVTTPPTVPCGRAFRLRPDTGQCIDIDECSEERHECNPDTQICQNSHGAYTCLAKPPTGSCPAGFKWNRDKCEDVDECAEGLHDCREPDEDCRNTIGGYECEARCPHSMIYDVTQDRCVEEVDKCKAGLHKCTPEEMCLQEEGGVQCLDQCPPGYKPTPSNICEDVDECTEFADACDPDTEVCENSEGRYQCLPLEATPRTTTTESPIPRCPSGLQFDDNTRQCVDIDECARREDACDRSTQDCINSPGGYQCVPRGRRCPPGYRNVGNDCEDIDECLEGRHKCLPYREHCENVPGGYRCNQLSQQPSQEPHQLPSRQPSQQPNRQPTQQPSWQPSQQPSQQPNQRPNRQHSQPQPCPRGRRFDPSTGSCEDINECSEHTDSCDRRIEKCINTPGSFQCYRETTCGNGYLFDGSICEDIDECVTLRPCEADQYCENTPGSYRCVCRQGYTLDIITRKCKDVNECQLGLHDCEHSSQRCDNTIGSFTCVRYISCGTGYTLNAHIDKCEDDDECEIGHHNCGPGFECRNTLGSFRCDRVRCPLGQKLLGDGSCKLVVCGKGMQADEAGNCIDVNECAQPSTCRQNQRCINIVGSHRCQNLITCGPGFEINEIGDGCDDVDECENNIAECGQDQTCRNRPGGYTCECPKGYKLNNRRECEDVDECQLFRGQICSSNADCLNTQGSYRCVCDKGFQGQDNSCLDVDECKETPGICQQTCNNVWGSYKCSCRLGYTLAADKTNCQDVDECEVYGGQGTLCIGICVNEPGSFRCSCPSGYTLSSDGRTCQDNDECLVEGTCAEGEVCLNTRGGHRCNRIDCPPGYARDKEHRNRCKRNCGGSSRERCLSEPLSFSFNYITFISNMRLPLSGQVDLFTMRGPRYSDTSVNFQLEMASSSGSAQREHFYLRRTAHNEAMVSLVRSLPGPQDIQLDLKMKMYHNGLFGGTAVAKIFIFVTQHEF